MFSDYDLFGSGLLSLLAFDDGMLKDLSCMNHSRQSVYIAQLNGHAILRAWQANKRHLNAISKPEPVTNYGRRTMECGRKSSILHVRDIQVGQMHESDLMFE
ncbi:hypothetical protein V1506DRAFT_549073 [Lipomyces tetrasporus]